MVATLSSFVHSGYLKSGKMVLQQVEKKWIVECHNEVHIVVDSSKTKFSYTGRKKELQHKQSAFSGSSYNIHWLQTVRYREKRIQKWIMECKHINYVSAYKYQGVTMVEIGILIVFEHLCSFVCALKNKSIYIHDLPYSPQLDFGGFVLCVVLGAAYAIHEWHVKFEFIEQKTTNFAMSHSPLLYVYTNQTMRYRFGEIYLHHQSKMDRHHVYSTTILRRLLWNTSLLCAIH